jgi:hypothetical protein
MVFTILHCMPLVLCIVKHTEIPARECVECTLTNLGLQGQYVTSGPQWSIEHIEIDGHLQR